MAVEIKVPAVGESITEGTLARWFKKDGDSIRADEPLYELETEKATTEVAAPGTGTLHIAVPEGQTVAIGSVIGRLEAGAGTPEQPPAKKKEEARKTPEVATPSDKQTKNTEAAPETVAQVTEVPLSPAVRRLVREEGVDVQELKGTGPGGRITREDVLTQLAKQRKQTTAAPPVEETKQQAATAAPRETRERLSAIRQRIAERLVSAQQTAAILTTFNEVDMSAVMAMRSRHKEAFQKKNGVGLGLMSFFVKASVEALRTLPVVNAWIDGGEIVYHHYYNIGVAVSTEKGLMVPVLHDADRLSFAAIEKSIAELAQKARDGKIGISDLQGGTFTITNGGIFGSLLSTPILNPPQSAILGMHTIQKRPMAINDQVTILPMMYLALSYDHRLIDGREAVQFLIRIKECLESPERLLLET